MTSDTRRLRGCGGTFRRVGMNSPRSRAGFTGGGVEWGERAGAILLQMHGCSPPGLHRGTCDTFRTFFFPPTVASPKEKDGTWQCCLHLEAQADRRRVIGCRRRLGNPQPGQDRLSGSLHSLKDDRCRPLRNAQVQQQLLWKTKQNKKAENKLE